MILLGTALRLAVGDVPGQVLGQESGQGCVTPARRSHGLANADECQTQLTGWGRFLPSILPRGSKCRRTTRRRSRHLDDAQRQQKDPILAIFVQGVNQERGWEFGVTLDVNGVIISGILCSNASFFKEQADMIRDVAAPETAESRQAFATNLRFSSLTKFRRIQMFVTMIVKRLRLPTCGQICQSLFICGGHRARPGGAVLPERLWRGRLGSC